MNAMIQELEKLSTTETLTIKEFQKLAPIVLDLAKVLETKQDKPSDHDVNLRKMTRPTGE
jgi:hypothetical protein